MIARFENMMRRARVQILSTLSQTMRLVPMTSEDGSSLPDPSRTEFEFNGVFLDPQEGHTPTTFLSTTLVDEDLCRVWLNDEFATMRVGDIVQVAAHPAGQRYMISEIDTDVEGGMTLFLLRYKLP